MSADTPRDDTSEAAEAIADALSRLRRRGGVRGHGPHGHGRPGHDHSGHGRQGHGRFGDEHAEHTEHAHRDRGFPGWAPDRRQLGGGAAGSDGRHDFPARLRVLEALAAASEPLGVSALAEAVGVDQPRASRLVQQGVEQGWLRREADPDDARRTRIVLTERGRAAFGGIRGARRDRFAGALEGFTAAERTELARLLTKLADNWEADPAGWAEPAG